jgi:hypothetical protein
MEHVARLEFGEKFLNVGLPSIFAEISRRIIVTLYLLSHYQRLIHRLLRSFRSPSSRRWLRLPLPPQSRKHQSRLHAGEMSALRPHHLKDKSPTASSPSGVDVDAASLDAASPSTNAPLSTDEELFSVQRPFSTTILSSRIHQRLAWREPPQSRQG